MLCPITLLLVAGCVAASDATDASASDGYVDNQGPSFIPLVRRGSGSFKPVTELSMEWNDEDPNSNARVDVSLDTQHPSFLLEANDDITSVICNSGSMSITLSSKAVYDEAKEEWSGLDELVFITNHLGNCDVANERGFFLAKSLEWAEDSLTVTADASRTDVAKISRNMDIVFASIPATEAQKRQLSGQNSSLLKSNFIMPANSKLSTGGSLADLTATQGSLNSSFTFNGGVGVDVLQSKLKTGFFDVESRFDVNTALTLGVKAGYTGNFGQRPVSLGIDLINIPGIVTVRPNFRVGVGIELEATTKFDSSIKLGVGLERGTVHFNLTSPELTTVDNWRPTFSFDLRSSDRVEARMSPYVSVGMSLDVRLINGVIDLTTGLEAKPKFNTRLTVSGTPEVDTSGSGSWKIDHSKSQGECTQGFEVSTDFEVSLLATVGPFWFTPLLSKTPISDACYAWSRD